MATWRGRGRCRIDAAKGFRPPKGGPAGSSEAEHGGDEERRMRFSEREGFVEGRSILQEDWLDDDTRMDFYNYLYRGIKVFYEGLHYYILPYSTKPIVGPRTEPYWWAFTEAVWVELWRQEAETLDDDPINEQWETILDGLRDRVLHGEWYETLDFVECIAELDFIKLDLDDLDRLLKKDMVGWRFERSTGEFIRMNDPTELEAISQALSLEPPFAAARGHIEGALGMLSRRDGTGPDTANAVKEAISAVEAAARTVSGKQKATLGDALKELEKMGKVHPALKEAWERLYGYTSDDGGIRHALTEGGEPPDFQTARFMVVACAAFVNLLSAVPLAGGSL